MREDDEPWYHQLLCEVGKLNGGYEILLNTSFNVKVGSFICFGFTGRPKNLFNIQISIKGQVRDWYCVSL